MPRPPSNAISLDHEALYEIGGRGKCVVDHENREWHEKGEMEPRFEMKTTAFPYPLGNRSLEPISTSRVAVAL